MSKLYGYARVSTKSQRLDRQIKNIEDYAGERKIEKIYREKYTGTKLDRPEFQKLLKVLQSGDTIIFDSVSRMSRTAEEGYALYMKLIADGIELVFINEPHINTEYYKKMQASKIKISANSGKKSFDKFVQTLLDALSEFQNEETKEKIKVAFEQSQKEVDDLHSRISAGIKTTKINNEKLPPSERKQIGRVAGRKVETKKSKETKEKIRKLSKDFDGSLTDKEILELLNVTRNSYYKYKREMQLDV